MDEQNSQFSESVQNSKNIWVIISSVIITALVIGGGVYVWQRSSLKKTERNTQKQISMLQSQVDQLKQGQAQNIEVEDSSLPVEDETAGWKTYRNEEYGFEFKYPKSVVFISEKEEKFEDNIRISLQVDGGEDWQNIPFSLLSVFIWTKEEFDELINNPDSYSSTKLKSGMSRVIEKNNKVYELTFGFQDGPDQWIDFIRTDDYKKLLSTFKFTK